MNDETIVRTPPNLLQFLGMEEQQLLVSLANMQEELLLPGGRDGSLLVN